MRISTNMMFESGARRISELQSSLLKTQEMISANRRILTPADDPTAAARVLEVSQSQSMNTQFAENRNIATSSLKLEDSILDSITDLIQDVQTRIVEAGDGAYDNDQRRDIANDLRGRFEELMGYANTRDNEGNFMFAGYRTANQAFSSTLGGVVYNGDQGARSLQVGSVRNMPLSHSGDSVFMRIPSNRLYESGAAVSNSGTATVSSLSIADTSQLTRHDYNVVYDAANTEYVVTDLTLGTTVAIDQTGDPQTLEFDGLRMTVTGAPGDGDVFMVREALTEEAGRLLIENISGQYVTEATATNVGLATISASNVYDISLLTGQEYQIVYDDTVGPPAVFHVTGTPAVPAIADIDATSDPQTLNINGLSVTLSNTASLVNGDSFTITHSPVAQAGYFVSGAAVDNAGTGSASALSIANAALLTGHEYEVTYDATNSEFDITNLTTGATLTSIAYTGTPQTIAFDGLQMTLSGSLVDGDVFTVRQALEAGQSPVLIENGTESVFDMLEGLIGTLEGDILPSATSKEGLANGLAVANANFSNVLDHLLTIRASVGARLKEMESLDSSGANRDLQYTETISNLQDLDYVKAISELTMQKTTLDAAQQSYVKIMNLSLFQYL